MDESTIGDGPYVGPRPFARAERERFFGRAEEARTLASLVVAHRVVLVYAASGAGKTSLLNAGLIPLLEDEDGFEVFAPVRLRGLAEPDSRRNPYVVNLLANLARELGEEPPPGDSLAGFLAARPHRDEDEGLPAPRALVIDQFEELFTLYPEHWAQRAELFDELREALEQDPLLRLVLAIREDYIAQLDPYAASLPTRLRTRLRLEPLRREPALAAIALPLAAESRSFAPGVAEHLVDDLLKVRIHTLREQSIEVPGELVEPVQLQVVCRTLWSGLPAGVREIGETDLARVGSVSEVLSNYYGEAVHAAAAAGGIAEADLRERLEAAFITPIGTRGTVVGGGERIAGMPRASIDELEARHLVRAEFRAGARWFELAHDSLIRPIVASNAAVRDARRRRRERRLAFTAAAATVIAVGSAIAAVLLIGGDERPKRPRPPLIGVAQTRSPLSGLHLVRTLQSTAQPVAMTTTAGGRGLVVAADDGRIRLWDLNVGREVATLDYGDAGLLSADASRDNSEIIAAGTLGLRWWDLHGLGTRPPDQVRARTAADIAQSSDKTTTVTDVAFAPDSSYLLVRDQRAQLGDTFGGDPEVSDTGAPFAERVAKIAYSPTGTDVAAVASDGTARLRHLRVPAYEPTVPTRPERVLRARAGPIVSAAFSADGATVVTASRGGVELWRTTDGRLLKRLPTRGAPFTDARLSPKGTLVATAGIDGFLRVLSADTGQRVSVVRASLRPLSALRWAAAGQLLVTTGADGAVRVWANRAPIAPLSAPCSQAQFLLPATPAEDGARAGSPRLFVGSISCAARKGDPVRAPESGATSVACESKPGAGSVSLATAAGRCWVFVGVRPRTSRSSVAAGTRLGTAAGGPVRIELWENRNRGRSVANLWNPMLFLNVRDAGIPAYPGDNASRAAIADWMGTSARRAGLPAELPVMASLVESGLKNLDFGDQDSVGFFQMPLGRWNHGIYAGFRYRPDVQLQWFIDRAKQIRLERIARGRDPLHHPDAYGLWVADVTQPAAQYRFRFQLRLDEARQLLGMAVQAATPVAPAPAARDAVTPP